MILETSPDQSVAVGCYLVTILFRDLLIYDIVQVLRDRILKIADMFYCEAVFIIHARSA